jgi:hypothetical protein
VADESRLSPWMRNGRASFLAWVIALAAYIACRFAKIDAPEVTYGLIGFTGLLVGNLGIAQGQRTAKAEQRTKTNTARLDDLENGAAASERRETEWSRHRDHYDRGDDE